MPEESRTVPSADAAPGALRVELERDWFAPSGRVLLRKGTVLTVREQRLDGRIVEAEVNGKSYVLLPGEFRPLAYP